MSIPSSLLSHIPLTIQQDHAPFHQLVRVPGAVEDKQSIARNLNPATDKMREEKPLQDFYQENPRHFKEAEIKAQQAASDRAKKRILFPDIVNKLVDCDWDDTLRPEQPINHGGMNNALASAANAQADAANPNHDLVIIAKAFEDFRTKHPEKYEALALAGKSLEDQQAFPWLAQTLQHYVEFAMDQKLEEAKHFRPANGHNAISTVLAIAPDIKGQLDPKVLDPQTPEHQRAFNSFFRHFQRTYDALARSRVFKESKADLFAGFQPEFSALSPGLKVILFAGVQQNPAALPPELKKILFSDFDFQKEFSALDPKVKTALSGLPHFKQAASEEMEVPARLENFTLPVLKGKLKTLFADFQKEFSTLSPGLRAFLSKSAYFKQAAGKEASSTQPTQQEKLPIPFPDLRLQSMPGAQAYINSRTEKGEVRVFQTNRRDGDARAEVYTTGVGPNFHYMTGTPLHTVFDVKDADGKKTMAHFTPEFEKRAAQAPKEEIRIRTYEGSEDLEGTPSNRILGRQVSGKEQQKIMDGAYVEQMHRKGSSFLIKKAIQDMQEIGVIFSPDLEGEAIGDTVKDFSHMFELLETGVLKSLRCIFVNKARQKDLEKIMAQAKGLGLNTTFEQHPTIADAFAVRLSGDRSTEPFTMPEKRSSSDAEFETPDGKKHASYDAVFKEELYKARNHARQIGKDVGDKDVAKVVARAMHEEEREIARTQASRLGLDVGEKDLDRAVARARQLRMNVA